MPTFDIGSMAKVALEDKNLTEDDRKALKSLIN
jgi:hypothetical protein